MIKVATPGPNGCPLLRPGSEGVAVSPGNEAAPTRKGREMLERRIKAVAPPGTIIPKPRAQGDFRVKGDGIRRGQRARIYTIPNHKIPAKPHEKGIGFAELEQAYAEFRQSGRLTTEWFKLHLSACYNEGSCNFTTVGGLFILLGEAEYERPGVYWLKTKIGHG